MGYKMGMVNIFRVIWVFIKAIFIMEYHMDTGLCIIITAICIMDIGKMDLNMDKEHINLQTGMNIKVNLKMEKETGWAFKQI